MTDSQELNSPEQRTGRRRTDRIVGASAASKNSVEQATAAARSDITVVVSGPTGSGRGHLARAIHAWSSRSNFAITTFSAAGIPEEEQQRELFGVAATAEPLQGGGYEGALARARIKRLDGWTPNDLMIDVDVLCDIVADIGYVFNYTIRLGRMLDGDGIHSMELVLYDFAGGHSIGTIGLAAEGKQFLETAVRDALESLLADYLKANFDL